MPCRTADLIETPERLRILHTSSKAPRKQKQEREQETGQSSRQNREQPPSKRPRTSPPSCATKEKLHLETAQNISENGTDPIQYWIQNGRWRKQYFEQNGQVRDDFERNKSLKEFEKRDLLQEHCVKESFKSMHSFHRLYHLFARKRFSSSLRRKNLKFSFQTLNDQLPREIKSAQYRTVEYEIDLKGKKTITCANTRINASKSI